MSKGWDYKSGDWNLICDVCSKKVKAATTKERWDGFRVCNGCFETRQSLDFIRSRQDKISVDFARSQQTDQFVVLNLTQYISDTTTLLEDVATAANYYRSIGTVLYPEDADTVNGSLINLLEINSNSVDAPPPANLEMFTLSESITLSQGFGISVSDTLTLSENLSMSEGEYPADSFTITEAVNAFIVSNKIVNAHFVNEVTLG